MNANTQDDTRAIRLGDKIPEPGWGRIGTNTWDTLTYRKSADPYHPVCGIVRRIGREVKYFIAPAERALPSMRWQPSKRGEQFLEMDLSSNEIPAYSSLFQLARRLERRYYEAKEKIQIEDSDVRLLQDVVNGLLAEIELLHQHGIGVGALDPRNVLYLTKSGKCQSVVLPDVGFWWIGKMPAPTWLTEENEFRDLWHPFSLVNFHRSESDGPKFDPKADLNAVARMLAWLMTGQVPIAIPNRESDDSDSKEFWRGKNAFVWKTLYSVLQDPHGSAESLASDGAEFAPADRISSIKDLRTQVEKSGPGQHFVEEPPAPTGPPWWRPYLLPVLGLLVLAAIAAIPLLWRPPPPKVSDLCPYPACAESVSSLYSVLKDTEPTVKEFSDLIKQAEGSEKPPPDLLVDLSENLELQFQLLEQLHRAGRSTDDGTRAGEEKCLTRQNERYLECLKKHAEMLVAAELSLQDLTRLVGQLEGYLESYRGVPLAELPQDVDWMAKIYELMTPPFCPKCRPPSKFYPLLIAFEKVLNEWQEELYRDIPPDLADRLDERQVINDLQSTVTLQLLEDQLANLQSQLDKLREFDGVSSRETTGALGREEQACMQKLEKDFEKRLEIQSYVLVAVHRKMPSVDQPRLVQELVKLVETYGDLDDTTHLEEQSWFRDLNSL